MHFPNEILEKIIGYLVEHCTPLGSPAPHCVCNLKDCPAYLAQPKRDKCCNIQNIRLICRLFRDLGARFLVPRLSVSFSRASLHRLEAVSSHPLISRGVEAVRISLAGYDHILATDYTEFRLSHHASLLGQIELYEDLKREYEERGKVGWVYDPLKVETARSLAQKWSQEDGMDDKRFLRRGFLEYRRRYYEQEELLEQGIFYQKLLIALSSMPKARHLWIDDHEIRNWWYRETTLLDAMLESDRTLLEYLMGRDRLQGAPKPTLQQFIPSLLVRLPDTGIHIKSLWIHLAELRTEDLLWDVSKLSTAPGAPADLHAKLKLSMTNLRSLKFQQMRPIDGAILRSPHRSTASLAKCFWNLIQGDRIEDLSIDAGLSLSEMGVPMQITSPLGPISDIQKWSRLKRVQLTGMPLSSSEIVLFIEAIQNGNGLHQARRGHSIYQITCQVKDIYLLDGTWADLLDTMRAASGGSTAISLRMPSGAECHSMTEEERYQIFGHPWWVCPGLDRYPQNFSDYLSRAERYIWGQDAQNPFREETAKSSGTDSADEGG